MGLFLGNRLVSPVEIVNTGGGGFVGIPKEIVNGVWQNPTSSTSFVLPSNATDVGNYGFSYAFYNSSITSADFSSLTSVTGANAFDHAFCNSSITSVDFSSLTTLGIYSGESAFMNAFENTFITTVDFPLLEDAPYISFFEAFKGCMDISDIYFRALTSSGVQVYSIFTDMMLYTGSNKVHTIHFPSNLESDIQSQDGYPLFGGDSGYVVLAFDLPATS